jgi:DNA-binding MarR family transcriptional regulator
MQLTGSEHELSAILDDLRRIVRVLRESSRAAERKLGVTGAQLFALRNLAGDPPLSLNQLAARTRTHQSTVSVVVRRLVERDLVKRAPSALDARRLELSLTRRGRALLARAPLAAQDRLIEGLTRIDAHERHALASALHSLVGAMGLSAEPPHMFFEDDERESRERRPGRSSAHVDR